MDIPFAKRFDGVTGSAIRDILKLLNQPGMISFGGGNPAQFALEDDVIAELAVDVLRRDGKALLQYGATEGYMPLRKAAACYLKEEIGLDIDERHVLPTTGSSQGIDILLKAILNPGDVVLVEGPTFLGTLQAIRLYGGKLVEVPMDDQGIRIDLLEQAILTHKPRLLYTVPNFQNPTGVTMTRERRQAVVDLATRYDLLVAEDDPYRGLRYAGVPQPALFSLCPDERVIYLTSFSKLIAPGLRVGAVITKHEALMRRLVIGKQSTDVHSTGLAQAIVAEYLGRGLLPAHLAAIIPRYREQLDHMMQGLAALDVTVQRPEGGLFVWLTLREGMDAIALMKTCIARGVAFVPGTHFFADGGSLNTVRLNFSNSTPEEIDRGIKIFSTCVHEMEATL